MYKLLLRFNIKKEEARLESITFMDKCKWMYYAILSNVFFVFYLIYYAAMWITGFHTLKVFLVQKKKNVNILKYSDYDYIY